MRLTLLIVVALCASSAMATEPAVGATDRPTLPNTAVQGQLGDPTLKTNLVLRETDKRFIDLRIGLLGAFSLDKEGNFVLANSEEQPTGTDQAVCREIKDPCPIMNMVSPKYVRITEDSGAKILGLKYETFWGGSRSDQWTVSLIKKYAQTGSGRSAQLKIVGPRNRTFKVRDNLSPDFEASVREEDSFWQYIWGQQTWVIDFKKKGLWTTPLVPQGCWVQVPCEDLDGN